MSPRASPQRKGRGPTAKAAEAAKVETDEDVHKRLHANGWDTPLAAWHLDDTTQGPSLLPLRFQPTSFLTHSADLVLEVSATDTIADVKRKLQHKYEHFFDEHGWAMLGFVLKNPVNAAVIENATKVSLFLRDGACMFKVTTAEPEKMKQKVGGGWQIYAVDPQHGTPVDMKIFFER